MQYDFLIPLFAIVFGTMLTGVIFWKIFDFLKAWVTRGRGGVEQEKFDRLAKAFIQYRKENDRRMQQIEAALGGDSTLAASGGRQGTSEKVNNRTDHKVSQTIEIDHQKPETGRENEDSDHRIPNMLHKNRQRS